MSKPAQNMFAKREAAKPAPEINLQVVEQAIKPDVKGATARPKSRDGKEAVTQWVEPEVRRQIHKLAFDEDTTVKALMDEAINLLFNSRGLSRTAGR